MFTPRTQNPHSNINAIHFKFEHEIARGKVNRHEIVVNYYGRLEVGKYLRYNMSVNIFLLGLFLFKKTIYTPLHFPFKQFNLSRTIRTVVT